MNLQQTMNLATDHLRAGRVAEAESLFRSVLAQSPNHADALHLLGCTLAKTGRAGEGSELIRQAIRQNPNQAIFFNNLAFILLGAGDRREAVAAFRGALALQPNSPMTLTHLGNAYCDLGELDEAMKSYEAALVYLPQEPGLFYNLGNCWVRKANLVRLDLDSGDSSALATRNHCFHRAVDCFQRALSLTPIPGDIGNNLGNALQALGRRDEAIAAWRRVVASAAHPLSYYNLGRALCEKDLIDEAVEAMETSIRLLPNNPDSHVNLGNVYRQSARIEDSIAQFERALEIRPDSKLAHSNRLYTLYYHPGFDAEAILREHRKWNDTIARQSAPKIVRHSNDRSPARRLKIGYVSPNFWGHCQTFFTAALFSHHDHANFEIFCYSDVSVPDAATARIRGWADRWRSIVGMSDEDAAELIRRDGIDILIDLTVHMAHNRMLLFARRPAPVQVTWLGYPGTTGLETVDYRLTDPYLDPPGESDEFYVEKSVRLPHTFWCLDRAAMEGPDVPDVNAQPVQEYGHITFGCLNNFCKLNQPLLELWKRVLDAVAGSRMMILAPLGSCRDWVRRTLGNRVEFVQRQPRENYLKFYHRIDLGLDTLPYNGHTTTLDSLWMGVPVVTLVGKTVVGRAGLSQLSNLGLTDLAATTPQEFVEIAVRLASDLRRLAELRRTLRDRMRRSPLLDGSGFAADVEKTYRMTWKQYCESAGE